MAVYHYVANKDEILDGLVDRVFDEIDLPTPEGEWRAEIAKRAHSARVALRRHAWRLGCWSPDPRRAPPRCGTTTPTSPPCGPVASRSPRRHMPTLLGSYVYGSALHETSLPFEGPSDVTEVTESMMGLMDSGAFPHLVELATEHMMQPGYDFGDEFDFGLGLILDGLEQLRVKG